MTESSDAFEAWWDRLPEGLPTNPKDVAWMAYLEATLSLTHPEAQGNKDLGEPAEALTDVATVQALEKL